MEIFAIIILGFLILVILAINNRTKLKNRHKEKMICEFVTIDINDGWVKEKESVLKGFEKEYLFIEDVRILQLEIGRVNDKIQENIKLIRENEGFLDWKIALIWAMISFGLGIGLLDPAYMAIFNALGDNTVILQKLFSLIIYGMLIIELATLIVAPPIIISDLTFKKGIKEKEKECQKILSFNEELEIRKVAINNRIEELRSKKNHRRHLKG